MGWLSERWGKLISRLRDELSAATMTDLMGWLSERRDELISRVRGEPSPPTETQEELVAITALPPREDLIQNLGASPEKIRPFFIPEPITERELLIGRESEFQQLEEALGQWLNGRPCSLALIGPQGCGKTSLLNCFLQNISDEFEIVRGRIDRRLESQQAVLDYWSDLLGFEDRIEDTPTLIERIQEMPPGLIILDGGHNLLLRIIGGRQAAETFFYILLETRRRHLWLLTCRRWPWNNLCRHVHAETYFTHKIALDAPDEAQQREALERRAERTGLELHFAETKRRVESDDASEKHREEIAEDFYRDLFTASGGNLRAALYFWLLGSQFENNGKRVLLHPPGQLDTRFIRDLKRDHLLSLAETAGHGMLSPREHQRIFRVDALTSRLTFTLLYQLRLIEPNCEGLPDDDTPYSLDSVTQHAVTSMLDQMHFLY